MAWSDAGQRLEEMPDARPGGDSSISNRLAVSTPTTAACRHRDQSFATGGMIYDPVSFNRVHQLNRVVGGAVHPCASPGASERIQDWVLGGRAADTDRRSFGARGSHASRSHQHIAGAGPFGGI